MKDLDIMRVYGGGAKKFTDLAGLKEPNRLKRWWYGRGHRPKPGTWLYSPSLDLVYRWRDANRVLYETWEKTRMR